MESVYVVSCGFMNCPPALRYVPITVRPRVKAANRSVFALVTSSLTALAKRINIRLPRKDRLSHLLEILFNRIKERPEAFRGEGFP